MCAIAGVIGKEIESKAALRMFSTMARRGPDGQGIEKRNDCTLLHTRLAIIDPAGGAQPMRFSCRGEAYYIVYNGELYNTNEVRQTLTALGHEFTGHSDTEVLLHAYAQWGKECLYRLNGIFAFGIWEENKKTLFLARDRIGVKPLFYAKTEDCFVFASEIKTILASGFIKSRLDRQGAMELILLGPGRLGSSGVFCGIHALEPGCCAEFQDGKINIERYWHLTDAEFTDSWDETLEKVRFLVTDSIQRQMVSDVPIGTFLSGGLDSSIISAVCARKMREKNEILQTFSVDYLDNQRYFVPGKFQPNADTNYIKIMQEHLRTKHNWSILTTDDLENALEAATEARDLPGMADVDFSLLAFCSDVKTKVKVALSGECADEIFGGYPWYRDPEVRSRQGFPWAQNTQNRSELLLPSVCSSEAAQDFAQGYYLDTVRGADILPGTDPVERRMKEMFQLNFDWFMQTLLDRKDRMSMYNGLEVRVPFCDYRIAQYLYTVPWKFKDFKGREKGLLRKAVEGLLPDEILMRKKSPYPKTFDPKYDDCMTKRIEQLMTEDSPLFAIISKERLSKLLTENSPWPWYGQLMRHAQTCAYFLQMDFWLKRYEVELLF